MTRLDPRASQGAAVFAAAMAAIVSWQWGYQSTVRVCMRDRERIATLTARLRDVESMVQAAGGAEAWRSSHEQQLRQLTTRLPNPSQLPALLNALVDGLKAADVKLVNVEQANMEAAHDGQQQPILFQGMPCFQLPVIVTVEGRFSEMLAALERLTGEMFPSVLSIEQVDLRIKDAATVQLGAIFKVNLYVIGNPANPPAHAS